MHQGRDAWGGGAASRQQSRVEDDRKQAALAAAEAVSIEKATLAADLAVAQIHIRPVGVGVHNPGAGVGARADVDVAGTGNTAGLAVIGVFREPGSSNLCLVYHCPDEHFKPPTEPPPSAASSSAASLKLKDRGSGGCILVGNASVRLPSHCHLPTRGAVLHDGTVIAVRYEPNKMCPTPGAVVGNYNGRNAACVADPGSRTGTATVLGWNAGRSEALRRRFGARVTCRQADTACDDTELWETDGAAGGVCDDEKATEHSVHSWFVLPHLTRALRAYLGPKVLVLPGMHVPGLESVLVWETLTRVILVCSLFNGDSVLCVQEQPTGLDGVAVSNDVWHTKFLAPPQHLVSVFDGLAAPVGPKLDGLNQDGALAVQPPRPFRQLWFMISAAPAVDVYRYQSRNSQSWVGRFPTHPCFNAADRGGQCNTVNTCMLGDAGTMLALTVHRHGYAPQGCNGRAVCLMTLITRPICKSMPIPGHADANAGALTAAAAPESAPPSPTPPPTQRQSHHLPEGLARPCYTAGAAATLFEVARALASSEAAPPSARVSRGSMTTGHASRPWMAFSVATDEVALVNPGSNRVEFTLRFQALRFRLLSMIVLRARARGCTVTRAVATRDGDISESDNDDGYV